MMKKIKVRNSLVNLTDMIGFNSIMQIVLLKIKKKLKQDLKLVRIHSNAFKLFGTLPEFHIDVNESDKCWTFVLFTSIMEY